MTERSQKARDLAERLAGWFFLLLGAVLLASAYLLFRYNSALAISFAAAGLVVWVFGAFAKREAKVAVAKLVFSVLYLTS